MLFASVNGSKVQLSPSAKGTCPTCGKPVLAKCGRINRWHWAHVAGGDCDPWSEPIGRWHLSWQGLLLPEFVEVVRGNHRADMIARGGEVVELQHSSIGADEIAARERFYDNMIWMFDATERFRMVVSGPRAFFTLGRVKHIERCQKPVLLDFGRTIIQVVRFTTTLNGCSGYGFARDRQWFIDEYLQGQLDPSATVVLPNWSDHRQSDPWAAKPPVRSIGFATRWRFCKEGEPELLSRYTPMLPLDYTWRIGGGPWRHVRDIIIDELSDLANGWTTEELAEISERLMGRAVILHGSLRLVPAPAAKLDPKLPPNKLAELLKRVEAHVAAGRIPVLKPETIAAMRERAEKEWAPKVITPRPVATPKPSPVDPGLFDAR